jgi:hypothetical protein
MTNSPANYINHVNLVLDMSGSMQPHARDLIKVVDGQVAHLARRSQELDQETRVSVYVFDTTVECLVYDKDVLRLPSIASMYRPRGRTALVDATLKSLDDLSQTATLYGDHAFLTFVLTDGEENASRNRPFTLASRLQSLPDNWTVAALVPNQMGVHEARGFGFPPANIAVWDTTNAGGVVEVGETIRRATESFMTGRQSGVRGTRSLFSTGVDAVNAQTVSSLTPLTPGSFQIKVADRDYRMDELTPVLGRGFYRLDKRSTVQGHKNIAIREKSTGKVFLDRHARDVIGLPPVTTVVKPDYNPQYDIFVQSTAPNRKVPRGSEALVLR